MRPHGPQEELEERRRRAMVLLDWGMGLSEVAREVNATVTSVIRWRQAHRAGGDAALASKPVPGRPRKLKAKELEHLLEILSGGAREWGFFTDKWTLNHIRIVIKDEFDVEYHPGHIWKILKKAGWRRQAHKGWAVQEDKGEIAHLGSDKWQPSEKDKVEGILPGLLEEWL